jgi:hypothetical protein
MIRMMVKTRALLLWGNTFRKATVVTMVAVV